jgi:hypothetical protein
MSIFSREMEPAGGIQRTEIKLAIAEVVAICGIFVVAFTGRPYFSDGVRQMMIALSLMAGIFGALAGAWVLVRGLMIQPSRIIRLVMGGLMAAFGIYTIVHVL